MEVSTSALFSFPSNHISSSPAADFLKAKLSGEVVSSEDAKVLLKLEDSLSWQQFPANPISNELLNFYMEKTDNARTNGINSFHQRFSTRDILLSRMMPAQSEELDAALRSANSSHGFNFGKGNNLNDNNPLKRKRMTGTTEAVTVDECYYVKNELIDLKHAWSEAFLSLSDAFFDNEIEEFVLEDKDFMIIYGKKKTSDMSEARAIITHSTLAFRKQLVMSDVRFEAPLEPKLENILLPTTAAEHEASLKTSARATLSRTDSHFDGQDSSLLLFKGLFRIQCLTTFLLNFYARTEGWINVPTIYLAKPKDNNISSKLHSFVLRKPKISFIPIKPANGISDLNGSSGYKVRFDGVFMPSVAKEVQAVIAKESKITGQWKTHSTCSLLQKALHP